MTIKPLFDRGTPLPRGPHRLPRESVEESQRMRLLGAVTELVAEQGYAAVTMGALAGRAGVSRGTFYTHFADKETCFLAAYGHFSQALVTRVLDELHDDPPWEAFIDRALAAYLGTLDAEPAAARAFLVHMEAAGPEARARRRETMDGFAELLAARHAAMLGAEEAPLPKQAYLGLALGIRELVREQLEDTPPADHPALIDTLHSEIVAWIRAMIAGAGGPA